MFNELWPISRGRTAAISYVQSQVPKVPRYPVRIQTSLLIWLKVVKQAREPLGFFVKLRDILRPQRGGTL
jgi:hypothetical protein